MKLQIFDRSNAHVAANRTDYRAISFNRRNAKMTFTKRAAAELNVGEYQSIIVARDTDSKNNAWYMRLVKTDEGIPVRLKNGTGYCKSVQSYICCSRVVTGNLLDSLNAESGATLLIAQKPISIEGEEWYELVTSKPIRKK